MAGEWTRPANVRDRVAKKWPTLLADFAAGRTGRRSTSRCAVRPPPRSAPASPLSRRGSPNGSRASSGPLRVEYKQVGGRLVGTNLIPSRALLESYDQAWELLGARAKIRQFTALADRTRAECPRLAPWLERRPVKVLELAADWADVLATVRWIDERQVPGMYLRQVDVPGVDTKFIGRHRGVLTELLDLQLAPNRIDVTAPDFEGRYGFARKPGYVRLRTASRPAWLYRAGRPGR